jgi:hypothetical protein
MSPEDKRLLKHYRALSEAGRTSLLDYAEFLSTRDAGRAAEVSQTPLDMPRPEEESVVKAIKRLMATYPMLARDKLLNDTSALMTQHVVHKHPAVEIIDQLEALFRRNYDQHLQSKAEP